MTIRVKNLFYFMIIVLVIKLSWLPLFDNRPLKFEQYKTFEEFEKITQEIFPIGSNLLDAAKILRDSKADCFVHINGEEYIYFSTPAKFKFYCEYKPDFISIYQYATYIVSLEFNENLKLMFVDSNRMNPEFWW